MKRNLILFGVFVVLMGVTYFFQEKRVEEAHHEEDRQNQLINFEIKTIGLPSVTATRVNGQWKSEGQLLSHNTFKLIEKKLTEIRKIKEVSGEWNTYFPNPFSFKINDIPWTIGDLSLDKQGFYIAQDKKVYLAYIEGESHDLAKDPDEIAGIKLNELVRALSKSKDELIENQLFRYYPDLPLGKVILSSDGSLPFELDFEKNMTLPPPIEGINVHKDLRGKFYSLLTQVTMREEIPYSEKLKVKKIGEIVFQKEQSVLKWELWLRNEKSADALIIDDKNKKAYLMVGGTLKIFFVRIQEYWDKKIIPQENFLSFTRLETTFVQGSKKARVIILNREPMAFEAKGYKVQDLKMEQLVQFIFNLGPKDQADRVSILSKTEKAQLLTEENLQMNVMDQDLVLWRKKEELIVANLTQGFKAHFSLLDENFRGTFEDVLK